MNVQPQRCRQATHFERPTFSVFSPLSASRTFPASRTQYDSACHTTREKRVMNPKSNLALALVVGAAVGAAAVHGLHAQAKPKAYQVTELEIIDNAAYQEFSKAVRASQQTAGGRNLRTAMGKVVA